MTPSIYSGRKHGNRLPMGSIVEAAHSEPRPCTGIQLLARISSSNYALIVVLDGHYVRPAFAQCDDIRAIHFKQPRVGSKVQGCSGHDDEDFLQF